MSLSLKLELDSNNKVLATNSITQEKREISLSFIKEVTRNNLDCLIQYKFYEILIDAERVWSQIEKFDSSREATKEIDVERKIQKIMTSGSWIEITEYEKQQYKKALSVTEIYSYKTGIAKTAKVIRRLENFDWQIVDKNKDYITMINYGDQTSLFIPNRSEMNQKTLVKLLNEAKLSISEFFSPA